MGRNAGQKSSHPGEGDLWECSPHPGGTPLTSRLADMVGIREPCVVLDAAAGRGESALHLARAYGCRLVTVDLSPWVADDSRQRSHASSVEHLLSFVAGDAEKLPFRAGSFDVLLCECSFSLLNRKYTVAREFHRVLRSGGRVGIADFYLRPNATLPASKLRVCPPGTETEETYRAMLLEGGFREIRFEDETQKLKEHFVDLLFSSDCAGSLLDRLPGRAERAAHFKSVGYCVMTATKG